MVISQSGSISNLEFLILPHSYQELLVDGSEFRQASSRSGVAHAFYRGRLLMCSTDGLDFSISQARLILEGRLNARFDLAQTEMIKDFGSDEVWFAVGCPIIRDSLRAAIWNRVKDNHELWLRDYAVFSKKAEASHDLVAHVLYGVSFGDFVRVDDNKLGLCIGGRLEVFDTQKQIVQDQSLRTKLLSSANWRFEHLHSQYYPMIVDAVFPFEMHIGKITLRFDRSYLGIPEGETAVPKKETGSLDNWF